MHQPQTDFHLTPIIYYDISTHTPTPTLQSPFLVRAVHDQRKLCRIKLIIRLAAVSRLSSANKLFPPAWGPCASARTCGTILFVYDNGAAEWLISLVDKALLCAGGALVQCLYMRTQQITPSKKSPCKIKWDLCVMWTNLYAVDYLWTVDVSHSDETKVFFCGNNQCDSIELRAARQNTECGKYEYSITLQLDIA